MRYADAAFAEAFVFAGLSFYPVLRGNAELLIANVYVEIGIAYTNRLRERAYGEGAELQGQTHGGRDDAG